MAKTLSTARYIYFLIAVILSLSASTTGYMFWINRELDRVENITSEYHLAIVNGCAQIKSDLWELREGVETALAAKTPLSPSGSFYLLGKKVENIRLLQEQFQMPEFADTTIRTERDFLTLSEAPDSLVNPKKFAEAIRFFLIDLEQLRRLHAYAYQDSVREVEKKRMDNARNFLIFVGVMLCLGLALTHRILRLIREKETELETTRQKMFSSSKMSALGEMSGGIAHEINNPLTVIHCGATNLQLLAADGPPDQAQVLETASQIEATAMRISKIIRSLRAIARDAEHDPFEATSLKVMVEDTLELCQQRFNHHKVKLIVDPIPEKLELDCRAVQLTQVLLNLLNNAYDAVQPVPDKWIRISVAEDGGNVEIFVTDSGRGIAPELREKIFYPFFTTKELGKGTGLGLSVSLGIVEGHRGTLRIDSSSPSTTFIVSLPKRQPGAVPSLQRAAA